MKKIYLLLLACILVGCTKASLEQDNTAPTQTHKPSADNSDTHIANGPMRAIKLGEKLNNPYSVANMTMALELLRDSLSRPNQTGISLDAANAVEIYTTNLYVRLCATDEASNRVLLNDSDLSLFSSPRDYSVVEPGDYYIDTIGVADTKYQWWYATVKPDFQPVDGICCEVLDELFIPRNSRYYSETPIDPNNINSVNGRVMDDNFMLSLLIASFNITDNQRELLDREERQAMFGTRGSTANVRSFMGAPLAPISTRAESYTPQGSVKLYIDELNTHKALVNVTVRVARWFEEDNFLTNNLGLYVGNKSWPEIGLFNDLEYQVHLKGDNNGYQYRISPMVYNIGVHGLQGLTIIFEQSSAMWGPAIVCENINDYFKKCVKTSKMHPITQDLNITASNKGTSGGAAYLGFPTDIEIIYNPHNYYGIKESVYHEFTHASFFENMGMISGYDYARNFWSTVYYTELRNILERGSPYGLKGYDGWEYIALAEGWAYFISDTLLYKHYGRRGSSYREHYSENHFPYNYQIMFRQLATEAKIPLTDLQRALTVNNLYKFKERLKSFYIGDNDYITGNTGGIIGWPPSKSVGGGFIGGGVIMKPLPKRSTTIEKIMEKYL